MGKEYITFSNRETNRGTDLEAKFSHNNKINEDNLIECKGTSRQNSVITIK